MRRLPGERAAIEGADEGEESGTDDAGE